LNLSKRGLQPGVIEILVVGGLPHLRMCESSVIEEVATARLKRCRRQSTIASSGGTLATGGMAESGGTGGAGIDATFRSFRHVT